MRELKDVSLTGIAVAGVVIAVLVGIGATVLWSALNTDSSQRSPAVTETQARSIAIQWLNSSSTPVGGPGGGPRVMGWTVASDRYELSSARVTDSSGHVVMTESHNFCVPVLMKCAGSPVWEVELTAPSQGEWARYDSIIIIDGSSGVVRDASVTGRN